MRVIKDEKVLQIIALLVIKMLESDYVPSAFHLARKVLIYKKGDTNNIRN